MKKRFSLLAVFSVLIALSVILSACAPAATPAPAAAATAAPVTVKETVVVEKNVEKVVTATAAPAGPVTITFWHAYNADVEAKLLDDTLIPAFEAAHPNIKVESVLVPYDQFRRKLLTSIAGGTAPDLIRSDIIWVPEFADMGALARLDQVMPDFQKYADAMFPGPLSTNFYQGGYYGLPLDTNTRVLVSNNAMLAAAGITDLPKTTDDFLKDCAAIKKLGKDKYCFADGGTYAWAVNPWIWSFGGDVTDKDITKASGVLNGPDSVTAFNFLKDAVKNGYIYPGIKGGGVDTNGLFAKDQLAFFFDGPWFPPSFVKQFPDKKFTLSLIPAGKAGSVSVVGGEDIVMFQQSQHKEAAAEFIRFMLSDDTQLKFAAKGQMPVLKSLETSDQIKNDPYLPMFYEQIKTAKARTPHPNWSKIEDILTQAGGTILNGADAQKTLDDAVAKIDPLLKPAQ